MAGLTGSHGRSPWRGWIRWMQTSPRTMPEGTNDSTHLTRAPRALRGRASRVSWARRTPPRQLCRSPMGKQSAGVPFLLGAATANARGGGPEARKGCGALRIGAVDGDEAAARGETPYMRVRRRLWAARRRRDLRKWDLSRQESGRRNFAFQTVRIRGQVNLILRAPKVAAVARQAVQVHRRVQR